MSKATPKLIFFQSGKRISDKGLTREEMNWSKIAGDIQKKKREELKELIRPWYEELVNSCKDVNSTGINPYPDRRRFLERVIEGLSSYLDPGTYPDNENNIYYILLYALEYDREDFLTTIDKNDNICVELPDSMSGKASIFMFKELTKHIGDNKIEELLSDIFKK